MVLVLVCLGSLCETEGYVCLGACLVSCLNSGDEVFFKPAFSYSLVPLLMAMAGIVLLLTHAGILLIVLGVTA